MEAYAIQLDEKLQPDNVPTYITSKKHSGIENANSVLYTIEGSLLHFAIPVAILMIIITGLRMVIYGDESDQIDNLKQGLKWSVIGLIIVILSYSLVKITISLSIEAATSVS